MDKKIHILTPPQPSWLNKASLIELSCSILADDVLFPLFPLPLVTDDPFELADGLDGLLAPLPLPPLFVPKT